MEYRLKVEEETVRIETVQLLGRMFAEEASLLAQENMSLWQSFCGRFQDVSVKVRLQCIKLSQFLLVYHPEIRRATAEKLELCLVDGMDEVRLATVQSVLASAKENLDCVSDRLLEGVADRIRDKKYAVRHASVKGLAKLYNHVLSSYDESVNERLQQINWIPSKILHCYYLQSIEDKLLVEQVVHMQVIPMWQETEDGRQMTPDQQRSDRVLTMYSSLDDSACRAFREILRTQTHISGIFKDIVVKHTEDDDEEEEERERIRMSLTTRLAAYLEDPLRAKEHLSQLWSKLNDKRLSLCLKTVTSRESSCSEVAQAALETLRKLGEKSPIRHTVDSLFHRASFRVVDGNAILLLLKKLKQLLENVEHAAGDIGSEDKRSKRDNGVVVDVTSAVHLIQILGEVCPWLFTTSDAIHILLVLANEKEELVATTSLQILTAVGKEELTKTLRGLAGTVSNVVNKLALDGSPHQAKCGLRAVLSINSGVDRFFTQLYKKLFNRLDTSDAQLLTVLMSLRFVAEAVPSLVLKQRQEVITDFVVMLLATDVGPGTKGSSWCEKSKLSRETRVKLSCLKVLVHFLEGLNTHDDARTAKKFFDKIVDLLGTAIQRHGDLNDTGIPSSVDCAWLRSTAASSLMHLACGSSACRQSLDPYPIFSAFALIAQDDCFEVRQRFLIKLNGLLVRKRLKPHYMAFFCFYAFEKNRKLKSQAKSLLAKQVNSWREYARLQCQSLDNAVLLLPEYVVPTVVYLLAHHNDYGENDQSLYRLRDYLWFFLETVTHRSDNLGFIKSLLEMIKYTHDTTVCDGKEEQDAADKRLYAVAELAYMILSMKITNFRQFEFPGRAGLPPTLYRTKDEHVVIQKILPTSFNIYPKRDPSASDLCGIQTTSSSRVNSSSGARKQSRKSSESSEQCRSIESREGKKDRTAGSKCLSKGKSLSVKGIKKVAVRNDEEKMDALQNYQSAAKNSEDMSAVSGIVTAVGVKKRLEASSNMPRKDIQSKQSSIKQSFKRELSQVTTDEALDILSSSGNDTGETAASLSDDGLKDSLPKYQRKGRRVKAIESLVPSPVKFRGKRQRPLNESSSSTAKVKKVEKAKVSASPQKATVHRQRQLHWKSKMSRNRRR